MGCVQRKDVIRAVLICLGLVGATLFGGVTAYAVNINVAAGAVVIDNTDGKCSLREAIQNANDDAQTNTDCPAGSGADVIQLVNSTYTLTDGPFTANGQNGLPSITTEITIQGNGAIIERDLSLACLETPNFRIFHVSSTGTLTLNGVTVRNGCAGITSGGGLYNDNGTVTITNSTFSANSAPGGTSSNGGGLYNYSGTVTITSSTFSNNSSSNGSGGGLYNDGGGTVTITGNAFSGNSSKWGGGLYNTGGGSTVTITSSTFSDNSATNYGGGLYNVDSTANATVTITGSTFSNNSATNYDGGGLYNFKGGVTIASSTFSDNSAPGGSGGGLYNDGGGTVEISNSSAFSGNSAGTDGGGLYNAPDGQVTITSSTFSNNSATNYGGGLYNAASSATNLAMVTITSSTFSNNSASAGGGLYDFEGGVTITDSTFSNNSASAGGGLYNFKGGVLIINSTFSNNSASAGGGGLWQSSSSGQVWITSSTFYGNSATTNGGGLYSAGGTIVIKNSIVANSGPDDCSIVTGSVQWNFFAMGQNFDTDGTCVAAYNNNVNITTSVNLNLGTLQNNGGPTFTHALQAGSDAIDAATDCTDAINGWGNPGNPVTTDQRGVSRPQGADCDVGAFEARSFTLTMTGAGTGGGTVTNTGINCQIATGGTSGDCAETVVEGTIVTLTATPEADSVFASWSGDCDASGQVTMDADKSCTATFNLVGNGDVNGDGAVNIIDARICLQFAQGLISLTPSQQQACDVNGDGVVTKADAEEIAKFSIGLPSVLAWVGGGLALAGLLLGLPLLLLRRIRRKSIGLLPLLLLGVGLGLTSCGGGLLPAGTTGLLARVQGDTIVISVQEMPGGGLAAFSAGAGGFTFNSKTIQVTGLVPAPGWELLASQIDNAAGEVRFGLAHPTGGTVTGKVLTIQFLLKKTGGLGVEWDPAALTLGDANNQEIPAGQYETVP